MRALPFSPPPPLGHFGSHHDHRFKQRSPSRLRRRTKSFIALISLKDFFCVHESGRLANQSKLIPGPSREHLAFTPRASRDESIHPPCSLSCRRRPLPYSRISHSVFLSPGLRLPWLLCCALNSTLSLGIIAAQSYPLVTVMSKKWPPSTQRSTTIRVAKPRSVGLGPMHGSGDGSTHGGSH